MRRSFVAVVPYLAHPKSGGTVDVAGAARKLEKAESLLGETGNFGEDQDLRDLRRICAKWVADLASVLFSEKATKGEEAKLVQNASLWRCLVLVLRGDPDVIEDSTIAAVALGAAELLSEPSSGDEKLNLATEVLQTAFMEGGSSLRSLSIEHSCGILHFVCKTVPKAQWGHVGLRTPMRNIARHICVSLEDSPPSKRTYTMLCSKLLCLLGDIDDLSADNGESRKGYSDLSMAIARAAFFQMDLIDGYDSVLLLTEGRAPHDASQLGKRRQGRKRKRAEGERKNADGKLPFQSAFFRELDHIVSTRVLADSSAASSGSLQKIVSLIYECYLVALAHKRDRGLADLDSSRVGPGFSSSAGDSGGARVEKATRLRFRHYRVYRESALRMGSSLALAVTRPLRPRRQHQSSETGGNSFQKHLDDDNHERSGYTKSSGDRHVCGEDDCLHALLRIVTVIASHSVYQPSEDSSLGQEKALRGGVGAALTLLTGSQFHAILKQFGGLPSNALPYGKMLQYSSAFIRTCLQLQHRLFVAGEGLLGEKGERNCSLWVPTLFFCELEYAYLTSIERRPTTTSLLESIFDTFLQLRNVAKILKELSRFLIERRERMAGNSPTVGSLFDRDGAGFDLLAEFIERVPITESQEVVDTMCDLAKDSFHVGLADRCNANLGDLFRVVCRSLPISADNANNVSASIWQALQLLQQSLAQKDLVAEDVEICVWLHSLHQRCMYFYECVHPTHREPKMEEMLFDVLREHESDRHRRDGCEEALRSFALGILDRVHGETETLNMEIVQGGAGMRGDIETLVRFVFQGVRRDRAMMPLRAWTDILEHVFSLANYLSPSERRWVCDFLVESSLGDMGVEAQRYAYTMLEDATVYDVPLLTDGLVKSFVHEMTRGTWAQTAKPTQRRRKSEMKLPQRKKRIKDSSEMLFDLDSALNVPSAKRDIFSLTGEHVRRRIGEGFDKRFWENQGAFANEGTVQRRALAVGLATALPVDCFHDEAPLLTLMYVLLVYVAETTHAARRTLEEDGQLKAEPLRILLDQLCAGTHRLLSVYSSYFASAEGAEEDIYKHCMAVGEFVLDALYMRRTSADTGTAGETDLLRSSVERLWSLAFIEHAKRCSSFEDVIGTEQPSAKLVLLDNALVRKGLLLLLGDSSGEPSGRTPKRLLESTFALVNPDTGFLKDDLVRSPETFYFLVLAMCGAFREVPKAFGDAKSVSEKFGSWFFALPKRLSDEIGRSLSGTLESDGKLHKVVDSLHDIAWVLVTTWQRIRLWLGIQESDLEDIFVSDEDTPTTEPSQKVLQVHRCTGCVFLLILQVHMQHMLEDQRKDLGVLVATFAASLSDNEFVAFARLISTSAQTGKLPLRLQDGREAMLLPAARYLLLSIVMGAQRQFQLRACKSAAPSVALSLVDGVDEVVEMLASPQSLSPRLSNVERVKTIWDCIRFLIMRRDRWYITLGQLHRLLSGSAQVVSLVLHALSSHFGNAKFILLRGSAERYKEVQECLNHLAVLRSCVHVCASMVLALLLTNPLLAARSPVPLFLLLRSLQRAIATPPALAVVLMSMADSTSKSEGAHSTDCDEFIGASPVFSGSAHASHLRTCRRYARLLEAISGPRFEGKLRRFMPSLIAEYAMHAAIPTPSVPREVQEKATADIHWVSGATHTPGFGNEIRTELEQGIHWMVAVLSQHERIHIIQSLKGVELAMIRRVFKDYEQKSKYKGAK